MEASRVLQLTTPKTEEIGQKALTYSETIAALPPIKTADEYLYVNELWKAGKALLDEIDEGYDDIIKSAHKLHKDALAKKAKYYVPAETSVKAAKMLMNVYDAEQEAIRQAEQRRLQEEARKREEEARLQAAIEAEKEGAKEEAEQILEQPAYVPPVVLQKATPKVAGGPVFRTVWKHQVTDLMLLVKAVAAGQVPLAAIQANDVFLGQQARSLKDAMQIPGVKSYSERV